jgi:tripartite-type tricarboxylate transporter receptor subunit TctC
MRWHREFAVVGALLGCACTPTGLQAQNYPYKAIRTITGTSVGGPGDMVIRGAGQAITDTLGQPFVVENRPGASGILAAEACARSAPDGYNLCYCDHQGMAVLPAIRTKMSYDPRDIAPVILFGHTTSGIHIHPSLPAGSLQELFALAKQKANSITWSSFGPSSAATLYMEYFRRAKAVQFLNVSYKSASQAWTAMLSGEVMVSHFTLTAATLQAVKEGRAKTLMVSSEKRSPHLPDVPTYKEAGMEFALVTWFGLCAPAGTPRPIIQRLNAVVSKGLIDNPAMRAKFLASQGIQSDPPAGGAPETFADYIAAEQKKYAEIARVTGLKEE